MVLRQVLQTWEVACAPIRLLTSELVVAAKADIGMKKNMAALRTMLDTANGRSPRCSTAIKNKNQVANGEKGLDHGPHREILRIPDRSFGLKLDRLNRAYFLQSTFFQVYVI